MTDGGARGYRSGATLTFVTEVRRQASRRRSHLTLGSGLGFFCAADEIRDGEFPDAWCAKCDEILEHEGEWNARSEAQAQIKVVCSDCYVRIRERNRV